MTVEVPDDVLKAMKHFVEWAHSKDSSIDGIIVHDLPVFENWLTELGLLPPAPELPPEADIEADEGADGRA